ncbi:hypothetical protein [Nocardioides speluncae]|uniref:hypothetical protein n=1 Tax=Nocardioides speluncae TaxID=2670337 RepID=UPI000D68D0EA|nr:hypothetical protein [Nocardioides speluncae]
MSWVIVLILVIVAGLLVAGATTDQLRKRKRAVALEADSLRQVRKVADEDVTQFGEELQDLHIETMTTDLDTPMRQDYQRALDSYESAKSLLRDVAKPADVKEVTHALEDGRYAMACVLARRDDQPLPERRPPCFFNPAHGPAQTDVEWAPPGGVPREVPVCLADAERIRQGAEPAVRKVRAGNRMVPWYQGGPAYAPYAEGYFASYVVSGIMPIFLLSAMMPVWSDPAVQGMPAETPPDGWDGFGGDPGGSGDPGGGEWTGGGGDVGSGFDMGGGGFDGGGFDGGSF